MSLPDAVFKLASIVEANPGISPDDERVKGLPPDAITYARDRGIIKIEKTSVLAPPVPPHRGLRFVAGPSRLVLGPGGPSLVAEERLRRDELAADATPPVADTTSPDDGWILVSEAVALLPFIRTPKQLTKYAEENPDKLRLRPHPTHGRRRQANAADVLKLEMEYNRRQFDAMDGSAADDIPSVSEEGLNSLAAGLEQIRARKRQK